MANKKKGKKIRAETKFTLKKLLKKKFCQHKNVNKIHWVKNINCLPPKSLWLKLIIGTKQMSVFFLILSIRAYYSLKNILRREEKKERKKKKLS